MKEIQKSMKKQHQCGARLSRCVEKTLQEYFKNLKGESPCGVYQMLLSEVEKPLLKVVMKQVADNQTKAAKILGINRNTLRKKLQYYRLY